MTLSNMSSSRTAREVEKRIFRLLHDRKTQTKLSEIHAHFLRQELHGSNLLLAHFVSICGIFNRMSYAHLIFQQTPNPNILLFNSMIKGYSVSGPSKESLNLYSLMKEKGIWPDQYTFVPLLKSCSNVSDLKFGQRVHAQILIVGFEAYSSIGKGLVELYSSCEKMEDAKRVFDWMSQRDVVIWNLMISGFCKTGNVDMGLQIFRKMNERSIVSWNSMIAGLAQNGREFEAMEVFREMWDDGFEPDDATLVTILPVCAKLGDFDIGNWIYSYADSKGLSREVVAVGNSLVDFFCKSGDLETAQKIFNEMPRKSVISWNAMILGLAFNGEGELGLELFEKMKKHEHEPPNGSTFIGVLACCTHAGLVQKGRELFDSMTSEHKIKPNLQHHGCMVDLLGRSGCLKEAQELIQRMPMKPNAAIWGSLLSACRIHGDLELAEYASKELIHIEPWNSGNYVQLSNVYAELGKWDAVEKVRMMMIEKNVLKDPGHTVI